MKALLVAASALTLIASASTAFANGTKNISNSQAISGSQSISNSTANSNSSGSNNNTNYNQQKLQAPGIGGPGLAASGNACLGSVSGGVSGAGFGFVFGTTTEDKQCNLRENAKVLRSFGQKRAAVEILCKNTEMAEALAVGGYRCTIK